MIKKIAIKGKQKHYKDLDGKDDFKSVIECIIKYLGKKNVINENLDEDWKIIQIHIYGSLFIRISKLTNFIAKITKTFFAFIALNAIITAILDIFYTSTMNTFHY